MTNSHRTNSRSNRTRRQQPRLADHILALHNGIHEVFVLEERSGDYIVVDEVARNNKTVFSRRGEKYRHFNTIAPAIILGSAGQLRDGTGDPKLVGILYPDAGVMFAPLKEGRLVAISASADNFYEVMQTVDRSLPGLIQRETAATADEREYALVRSAPKAEEIAQDFIINKLPYTVVHVQQTSSRNGGGVWEVEGWYRLSNWQYLISLGSLPRWRRLKVEIEAQSGNIVGFTL